MLRQQKTMADEQRLRASVLLFALCGVVHVVKAGRTKFWRYAHFAL